MSDYTRIYNLTVKDSLPTGNSGKVIKGTELDAELNAVAAAISSKSDTNSPTFTGTPVAPTASYGTSTTQLATTAFVQAALQALYPVGSIYINASSNTNPATLLGFGTWEAFGAGKVMVGIDGTDTDFDTLGETGGSKASVAAHTHTFTTGTESVGHTHTFTTGTESVGHTHSGTTSIESQNHSHSGTTSAVSNDHTHTFSGTTATMNSNWSHSHSINDPGHVHTIYSGIGTSAINWPTNAEGDGNNPSYSANTTSSTTGISINAADINHTHNFSGTTSGISANHTHTLTTGGVSANHTHTITTGDRSAAHTHSGTTAGVSASHTHSGTTASTGNSNGNLQPYVVVRMWKRAA